MLPYKFYTCVNEVKYEFENLTSALDTLIKIFFVFDLKYPVECGNVLVFLQQFFFDIFLLSDLKSVNILSLMLKIDATRAKICNEKLLNKNFDSKFLNN